MAEDLGIKAIGTFHARVDHVMAHFKKRTIEIAKGESTDKEGLAENVRLEIANAANDLFRDYPK